MNHSNIIKKLAQLLNGVHDLFVDKNENVLNQQLHVQS